MKKLQEIIGTLFTFLSSTGFVYFGALAYAILIWAFARPFDWVGWILVGVFVQKNMDLIRPWALKQWTDLKRKF